MSLALALKRVVCSVVFVITKEENVVMSSNES